MKRRQLFVAGATLCICFCFQAGAWGADRIFRVGVLTPSESQWQKAALLEPLRAANYAEGRNLVVNVRSAEAQLERLDKLAAELVHAGVDAIVAVNTPGTRAAMKATRTVPIVMAAVGDPIGLGFVTNLARPGGNVTGMSNMANELVTRRLQLLKEAVPSAIRVAALIHPDEPIAALEFRDLEAAAPKLGIELRSFAARSQDDLRKAFDEASTWRADAAIRLAGQAGAFAAQTIELAQAHRLPVMHLQRSHVVDGGLMSYFADEGDLWRRVGAYVVRILGGEKPGDLPIMQPVRFELVINLKTARALGITIPESVLVRADEVIE
jgi:putative ABC transport system substrate-binding protein